MERKEVPDRFKRFMKPKSFLEQWRDKRNPPGGGGGSEQPQEVGPDHPEPCLVIEEVDPFAEFNDDAMSLEEELETYGFEERPWEDDVSCDSMEKDYEEIPEETVYGKYTSNYEKGENDKSKSDELKDQIHGFFQNIKEKQEEKKAEKTRERNENKEKREQQKRIDKLLKKAEERRENIDKQLTEKNKEEKSSKNGKNRLETQQVKIDNLKQKAAERREELNKLSIEKNPEEKQSSEKEAKSEKLQVKVAEKAKPNEKIKESNPRLEDFKQSIWELNTLEEIFNDLYQDVRNSENWTKQMNQSARSIQERIEDQKEMIDFWSHLGTLKENDIENNKTDVANLNNSVLENLNQMYEFALENPTTYEKNAENMAQRLNESKNNLVSKFQDINNKLENADPNNPFEMESLLNQMEHYNIEKLDQELNEALAGNQKEGDKQKTLDELKNLESMKLESKTEKENEKPAQLIELRIEEPTKELEKTESIEKTEKEEVKLVFENVKPERGTEFRVFTDGTLEFKGGSTSSGVRITKEVLNWKELPQNKNDEKVRVVANYFWETEKGEEIKVEGIKSEIYHNGYSTFIRPINEKGNQVRSEFTSRSLMSCEIPGYIEGTEQLLSTDYFEKASDVRTRGEILDLNESTLIMSGWEGYNDHYEIHQDDKGHIYVKYEYRIEDYGSMFLPGEIANQIEGWLEQNHMLICSRDKEKPIVIKSKTRTRSDRPERIIKDISFPYWGEPTKSEVVITNPDLKLTENAKESVKLRDELIRNGYNIKSIKINHQTGQDHKDEKLENDIFEILKSSYNDTYNSSLFKDVEIITNFNDKDNKYGNRANLDFLGIQRDGDKISSLELIEIKTSEGSSKYKEMDKATAYTNHYNSKLERNNTTPIVFIGFDIKNDENKTKEFGENIGSLIIGKNGIKELKENPQIFQSRLNDFKETQKLNQFKHSKFERDSIKEKILIECVKEEEKFNDYQVLLEHIDIIEDKLPNGIEFNKIGKGDPRGKNFEQKVKQELEKDGFKVASNVRLNYFGRFLEIDLIAFNDEKITVVSCKDKSSSTNPNSVSTDIRNDVNIIEFRMNQLGADEASLYVNVHPDISNSILEKYNEKQWGKNVNIKIRIEKNEI